MAGKKTKGRQKIEIKRIEDEDDRLVTFSKRRSGVYKKASELATLCGAEVAVVVFSPSGKAFSFGHPSIESVANRLLNRNPVPDDSTHPLVEAHRRVRINELNQYYSELVRQLEAEREREKALQKLTQETGAKGWWETPLDGLSFEEIQQRYASLQHIYGNLLKSMKEKLAAAPPSSSFAADCPAEENPFVPNASGTAPSAFPPIYGHGGQPF